MAAVPERGGDAHCQRQTCVSDAVGLLAVRQALMLLHPSSLPSPYGAGDLGHAAYRFVEFSKPRGSAWADPAARSYPWIDRRTTRCRCMPKSGPDQCRLVTTGAAGRERSTGARTDHPGAGPGGGALWARLRPSSARWSGTRVSVPRRRWLDQYAQFVHCARPMARSVAAMDSRAGDAEPRAVRRATRRCNRLDALRFEQYVLPSNGRRCASNAWRGCSCLAMCRFVARRAMSGGAPCTNRGHADRGDRAA
jgi:hypothetical protein